MNKKELEKLYYIFIDNLFASFPINAKYYNNKNSILPFNTIITNMGEKRRCNRFYYHAVSFVKLSLEQDSYLYKNTSGKINDKIIKYYIHDEKCSKIFCKTLKQYLSNDYTFDTILKECVDIKGSTASKAKRDVTQHKPKITYEQPIPKTSYQSSMMYGGFTVPYKSSTTYSHSTNISSVNTLSAIKTDYTIPSIIFTVPLLILFCCIAYAIIKCYCYISSRRVRDCRMADDGNKLPQSMSLSSESESVQFGSGKICDEKRF